MRLQKLDIFRGIAILLMIIFHINYSLLNIFNIDALNFSKIFWFIEGRISALLFIFIAWISFLLAEKKYWNKIIKKYIKVIALLSWISLLISLSTFLFFTEQYIRFWIIHFFALSFLLMLLFRLFKYYNFLFWIIFIIYWFYFIPVIESKYFYFLWFTYNWFSSAYYYPILPYLWIILLWYSLGLLLYNKNKLDIFKLKPYSNKFILKKIFIILNNFFEYMWKKSLIIYLIHQPIIIFIIYLFV